MTNTTETRKAPMIGTQFTMRGKPDVWTVSEIYTTTNSSGEVVKIRYGAVKSFCGQHLTDDDVCGLTILRNLVRP